MIKLTINDKLIEVEEGLTILEAAKTVGIDIPTFCWHPKLKVLGGCRVCLVQVNDMPKLQIACNTVVCEGMMVRTNAPQVIKARKGIIEMLLINHPLDCPTCDKGGECDLQDITFKYGSERSRFVEEKRRYIVDEKSSFDDLQIGPQIIRNQNRCVYCLKCIRFLKEIAGEYDLGAFQRGSKSEISVLSGIPIDNIYSGNVVEICPVGALTAKSFRYKTRVWNTKKVESICPFCGDGCNLSLWVNQNKIYRCTSRRNDRIDEGFICDKGRWGYDLVNQPERVKTPLIKKNGKFVEISWEEAYQYVKTRLSDIKDKNGSKALAGIGSERCTNEDNYIFQKFIRTVFGTNNLDHRVNYKNVLPSPGFNEYSQAYTMTNSIEKIEKAKSIIIFGSDLNSEHPIISLRVRKAVSKFDSTLLIANPMNIKLGSIAQKELIYRYGSEGFLINGLIRVLLDEKLYSKKIKEERIKDLRESLKDYTLNRIAEITAIDPDKISDFARRIATSENLMFLAGRWISHSPQAQGLIKALNNLLILLGKWAEKNSGINILWENNNSQGALDMGILPDSLPGYVPIQDDVGRERLEKFWNLKLSKDKGLNFNEILLAANAEKVKGLYIMQTDPVENFPDREYAELSLKKLEFLLVQDIFLTETAKLADVVLPGTSFAEKEGTFTNVERRVQKLNRALLPLYSSRPDWEIICNLFSIMGSKQHYSSPFQITEEISQISPIYGGIKTDRLEQEDLQWPCLNINDPGTEELLPEFFLNQEAKLNLIDFDKITLDNENPFILITGNLAHHCNELTRWSENICSIVSENFCHINPNDAFNLHMKTGEEVWVVSSKGKIKIKLKLDEYVLPGTVFIPLNFRDIKVNILMDKDKHVDNVKITKIE